MLEFYLYKNIKQNDSNRHTTRHGVVEAERILLIVLAGRRTPASTSPEKANPRSCAESGGIHSVFGRQQAKRSDSGGIVHWLPAATAPKAFDVRSKTLLWSRLERINRAADRHIIDFVLLGGNMVADGSTSTA